MIAFIEDDAVFTKVCARPAPIAEAVFERLGAHIRIEIAFAAPAERRVDEIDLDARASRDRAPDVLASRIEQIGAGDERARVQPDRAADTRRDRGGDLIDIDTQTIAVPMQRARPDRQRRGVAREAGATALGHRPAAVAAIERDVDRDMILRIAPRAPVIIGRKNAADKGDDGQSEAAVFAERIDIPPGIAAGWNRGVEARAAITCAAACAPDKAAIGTPAPG